MLHPWFVPMVMAAERPYPRGGSTATRNMEAEARGARPLNPYQFVSDTIALESTPRAKPGARLAMGCFEDTAAVCPKKC